ncbi:HNH endonuclease [Amycolatopsis sp. NPDC004368]
MPGNWAGSTRAARLPPDWGTRVATVMVRDHGICHVCGQAGADQVDHIEQGDDHDLRNLAPIHTHVPPYCHRAKSSAEGNDARWQHRRGRPAEQHPGLAED